MLMAKKNIVKSGLVLWLEGKDFTNTPQTTSWRDRSGLDNNGTPINMAYTTASGSDGSGGVAFDGVNDYVSLQDPLTIFDSSFSFECWLFFDDNSRAVILGDFGLSGSVNINIERNTSNVLRLYWGGIPDIVTGVNVLTTNIWQHIAIVRDKSASKVYFYVNSVLVYTYFGTISDKTATIPHRFGRDSRSGTTAFDGSMVDVRIYNRALTDSEIRQNYNVSR